MYFNFFFFKSNILTAQNLVDNYVQCFNNHVSRLSSVHFWLSPEPHGLFLKKNKTLIFIVLSYVTFWFLDDTSLVLRHLSIISDYNSQVWGWNGAPNWNVNMAAGWGVNLGEGSKVIHLKFLFFNNEYCGTQFSVIQFL